MNFQAAWTDYKETNRGKEAIAVFERGLSIFNKDSDKIEVEMSALLEKYFKPQLERYNYEMILLAY